MTKQERQALAKIALKNKNTKEGQELASLLQNRVAGDVDDLQKFHKMFSSIASAWIHLNVKMFAESEDQQVIDNYKNQMKKLFDAYKKYMK